MKKTGCILALPFYLFLGSCDLNSDKKEAEIPASTNTVATSELYLLSDDSRLGFSYEMLRGRVSGYFPSFAGKILVKDGQIARSGHVIQFLIDGYQAEKKGGLSGSHKVWAGQDKSNTVFLDANEFLAQLTITNLVPESVTDESGVSTDVENSEKRFNCEAVLNFNDIKKKIQFSISLSKSQPREGELVAYHMRSRFSVASEDFQAEKGAFRKMDEGLVASFKAQGKPLPPPIPLNQLDIKGMMDFDLDLRFFRNKPLPGEKRHSRPEWVWTGAMHHDLEYNFLLDINGDGAASSLELADYLSQRRMYGASELELEEESKRLFYVCPDIALIWQIFSLPEGAPIPEDAWWHPRYEADLSKPPLFLQKTSLEKSK